MVGVVSMRNEGGGDVVAMWQVAEWVVGVVSTRNEGGGTSSRRGRRVGGQWGSFQCETRAVGRRHDVAGG